MKATYSDFIQANRNCSNYASDPVAQAIFDLLSQDSAIIAMTEAADQGKPALGPCVQKIEDYAATLTAPSFDIQKGFDRSAVGRMVRIILAPFGYRKTTEKGLPKRWAGQYFSNGHCYALSAPEEATMRVVKRIEEI